MGKLIISMGKLIFINGKTHYFNGYFNFLSMGGSALDALALPG
jgi:hypothetical protein